MDQRIAYVVDKDVTDRAEVELIRAAVLDVLGAALQFVRIDVASPMQMPMPVPVGDAAQLLEALGAAQNPDSDDSRMGVVVEVDPSSAAWKAARVYAPRSVQVDLWDDARQWLGEFEEAGYRVRVALTDGELADLRQRLHGVAAIVSLDDFDRARRAKARTARVERLRSWLPRRRT